MIRDAVQIEAEKEFAVQKALAIGLEKGREEGLQAGAKQNAIENARNFKAAGIDASVIAQCIGLTLEEVEKL